MVRAVPPGRPDPRGNREGSHGPVAPREAERGREPANAGSLPDRIDPHDAALQGREARRRSRGRTPASADRSLRRPPGVKTAACVDLSREWAGRSWSGLFQLRSQVRDDRPERLSGLGLRVLDDERLAGVSADHDPRVERDATEERQAQFLRGCLAAANLENLSRLAAMWTHES